MPAGVSHSSLSININENKMNADDAASLEGEGGGAAPWARPVHHPEDQRRVGWGGEFMMLGMEDK